MRLVSRFQAQPASAPARARADGRTDPWRRFFSLTAGTAAAGIAVIWLFVVLVDPFDALPLSPPAERVPVATNARFAFPALARSPRFDSAIFGTSTSRLLRPATLDPLFTARFANLAMNDATVYEMTRLMTVFQRAHPAPRVIMVGLDVRWCETGASYLISTGRAFPAWLYDGPRWRGYAEMLNPYAVQSAGQLFAILLGLKAPVYGADGYTRFVPPDSAYDRAKVAHNLATSGPWMPSGPHNGSPDTWRHAALETLRGQLEALPTATRKLLFFVPYHRVTTPPPGTPVALAWDECKRRVAVLARAVPNTVAADFMRPSPITMSDDHYWDALHYTVAVADRLAHDLAAADQGLSGEDYRLLWPDVRR